MNKCQYGCEQEAKYFFKNGKQCCSKSVSLCSFRRNMVKEDYLSGKRKSGFVNYNKKNWRHKKGVFTHSKETINELKEKRDSNKEYFKTQEYSNKRSIEMKSRYANGWESTAGRCKKYDYESLIAGKVKLDGKWEVIVAKHLDLLGVTWKRNKERFPYLDPQGKLRTYQPDFYVKEWNKYIEVKGYETELDKYKWKQFPFILEVWKREKIKEIGEQTNIGL